MQASPPSSSSRKAENKVNRQRGEDSGRIREVPSSQTACMEPPLKGDDEEDEDDDLGHDENLRREGGSGGSSEKSNWPQYPSLGLF